MATFTRGPYPRVRPDSSRVARWALAGALLCLVLAAGCSGSLSLDPVASAADKTLDQQTGRFTLTINVRVPETGRTTISGEGSFDAAKQAAALTMNVPGLGAARSMEMRMLYPTTYIRFPGLP